MRGPQQLTLSPEAARQVAKQVRYVERLPRNRQPHRRQRPPRAAASTIKIGVLSTALNYGSSASVTFYAGTPGSEAPDGTGSHTCYGWMLKTGDGIPASSEVVCALINGYWYVIQAACPSSS